MSEPIVAYPLKEVLERIESKLDRQGEDIHKLQLAQSAQQAVSRSRAALYSAGVAAVTAGAALIVALSH